MFLSFLLLFNKKDPYLDSTPGFFWQNDEVYSVLREHDYGVEKGSNKVKFDHVSSKPSERLEFESKPIIVTNYNQARDDFNNFSEGIEAILGQLTDASLTKDSKSKKSVIEEYLTAIFGRQKTSLQKLVVERLKSTIPEQVEGTVQVTYGIPLSRYKQLLSITPFKSSEIKRLEEIFKQTFIGLLKVKSQIDTGDVTPVFYYKGKRISGEVRSLEEAGMVPTVAAVLAAQAEALIAMPASKRSKVTYVFDVERARIGSEYTDLYRYVMDKPNSNLYNFLFLIHNYINVLGFVYVKPTYRPVSNYELRGYAEKDINTGLKGTLPLMLRNKFSDIYKQLLSSEEKKLFNKYTNVVGAVDTAMSDTQSYYNLSSDTMLIAGFLDGYGKKQWDSYLPMGVRVPMVDTAITFKDGVDRNHHIIDYKLWLMSIRSPAGSRILWRTKYFERMLQKGLLKYAYPKINPDKITELKSKWRTINNLYENRPSGYRERIKTLEDQFDAFAKEWVKRSIKNPEADLLSPISAYASVISVIGDGKYAMGAYPVRNGQILFECRECISGQKRIQHFQKVGADLVEKFARDVCGISVELGKRRRRRRVARFTFPKKKRAPKKSRKPKRRSAKKSRKPKRRSAKKSRKPKRRSVKKSRKPKRRSAKKSRKPKRRSAKKSRKPKRRSAKKSRKNVGVRRSHVNLNVGAENNKFFI